MLAGLRGATKALALVVGLATTACAEIPADAYGIRRIRFHGVEQLDEEALRSCLASEERDVVGVELGTAGEPTCGQPPFDAQRASLRLFSWPWEDWPTYDEAVFERDLDRIERWYRARGYYDARVVGTAFDPAEARTDDELPEVGDPGCERRRDGEGCSLSIDVRVEEGLPVRVTDIVVHGHETLPGSLRERIARSVEFEQGDRFDEALHDASKDAMVHAMREAGYACAHVEGQVALDPQERTARVGYFVRAGEVSRFREVRVEIDGDARHLPVEVIRTATGIRSGLRYTPSAIASAQRDVYALGAFSAVEVEAVPVTAETGAARCTGDVDVLVRVSPGRRLRYGLGAGLDVGAPNVQTTGTVSTDASQWNVHFLARFEDRNFLGGIRRLRLEDRPKVVFTEQFPSTSGGARPGNEVTLEYRQPAFLERATTLSASMRHDYGPDPIYQNLRHFVDGHIDVQRRFLDGHVSALVGFSATAYVPVEDVVGTAPFALTYFTESVTVDYRDSPSRPRRGVYFQVSSQQAGVGGLLGSSHLMSWRYIRVEPEMRGFIPLPAGFTIAARFRVGYMAILRRYGDASLDQTSYDLGPSAYRMRAGGPTSHRGYSASALGDVVDTNGDGDPDLSGADGGLTKWEATIELRSQITEDFGAALFFDMGDVNRSHSFRFDQPHGAIGFGIRYFTIVGPVRLDFGFRPSWLATFGGAFDLTPQSEIFPHRRRVNTPGAITITIGDVF